MTLPDLIAEIAEIHRLLTDTDVAKYRRLLEAAAKARLRIYRCEKCGEFAAAERKTRRFCEECKR